MHSTRNAHLTMELVSEQLTKGNRSKIPTSPIKVHGCRILSVNNAVSSEYKCSTTTSKIPTPPQLFNREEMRRAAQNNTTKMHRPERPNIVVDKKTKTSKRRTALTQTKKYHNPKSKEITTNGKQAKVPTTRPSAPKKAGEVQRKKRTECGKARVGVELSTGRSRRGTAIKLANQSPESQLRRHSKPTENTQKANIRAPINQKLRSSTTSKDKSYELVKGKAQKSSSFKTLKKAGDGGVSSQVSSPLRKDKDKDLDKTPHPMVKVVVVQPPAAATTTTQKAPSSDLKPELSLWKRIKKMSSVKITSAWKTDQKLETRKSAQTDHKGPQKHEPDCASPERTSSNTIPNLIDRPSTAKPSSIVQDDSASTIEPMSVKNNLIELPSLTPRSPTDSLNQVEVEDSHQASTDSSDLSPKALSCVMENGGEPSSEGELHDTSDDAPPNPPPLTQFESCSVQCPEKLQEGDSSSFSSSPIDQPTCKTPTRHGSMVFGSMSSESPDLLLISNSGNSEPSSQRHGPFYLSNMPSMENNLDCTGTHSSRSQLRRVDSARIGAQCEFLRDTIKEESKRVMSMTSLLEALNRGPRTSSKKKKNVELAQTRELNKRQAEKIHDLEMENQHLRQLLEFSIGSIRRPSWRQGHAPDGQGYGDVFNIPVPTTDQADNELVNRINPKNKQSKRRKGKKSNAEIERIDRLQQNLESKDTLLKVITNSICQISSMHGYYQKRLEDLERDRSNIQEERSEHLNELLRFGIDLRADEIDAHKQRA